VQGVVQAGLVAERSVEPSNWKFFTVLYILESVVIKYQYKKNWYRRKPLGFSGADITTRSNPALKVNPRGLADRY